MSYNMSMSSEPPLRMRDAICMRVGILTGEGTNTPRGLSVCPSGLRESQRAVPIQPPEAQGAVLVARINTLGSAPW